MAQLVGEIGEPRAQARQRRAVDGAVELCHDAPVSERAASSTSASTERPPLRRLRGDDDAVAAAPEVDGALTRPRAFAGGCSSRISRSSSSTASKLRARHAALDPLQRAQSGLDGTSAAAVPCQYERNRLRRSRAPDVEHAVVGVAEEVAGAGAKERPGGERPLRVHAPGLRRREGEDVRDRAGAALLRQPQEVDEDLGGRLGVGQCAVARPGRGAEEPREGGETDPFGPAGERPPGEPGRSTTGAAIRRPLSRSTSRSRNARSKRAL